MLMKWLVASDIHGSAHYCKQLLAAWEREGADRLLLLGDILYHGPRNPLPEGYAPMEVAGLLNGLKGRVFGVRGNCDTEIDQMVLEFPILPDYCLLSFGDRLIFATHGHHYNKEAVPPIHSGDILLHGHTHLPAWEPFGDGLLYLNPGSVSIPFNNTPHSCMVLEENRAWWKTLDGEIYHELTL